MEDLGILAGIAIYLGFALFLIAAATRLMHRATAYRRTNRDIAERAWRREREAHEARRVIRHDDA